MSTLRTRFTAPLAIALALVLTPALSGCFSNPVEGIIEGVTGGDVDLGGTSVPDGYPVTEVPLASGEILFGAAIGNDEGKIYNVSVKVADASAIDSIKAQLEAAGFTSQGSIDATTTEGGTYIATPGELLVERMVKEYDRNGRAAGAGFYDYPAEKGAKKSLWPKLKELFEKPDATWDMQELKDRLLYRQAVETARCLSEGVLTSVHDANIGSIFGIGFPAWTGGAMQFIYGTGIDAFFHRSEVLASKFGPGFVIAPQVKDAVRKHQPKY